MCSSQWWWRGRDTRYFVVKDISASLRLLIVVEDKINPVSVACLVQQLTLSSQILSNAAFPLIVMMHHLFIHEASLAPLRV